MVIQIQTIEYENLFHLILFIIVEQQEFFILYESAKCEPTNATEL